MKLIIEKEGLKWKGKIKKLMYDIYKDERYYDYKIACTFIFYVDDDNNVWVNDIMTESEYQKKGLGTLMICEAIKEYGIIYFPNSVKSERNYFTKDRNKDFRYISTNFFKDSNLSKFANSLVKKNIIKKDWIKNPYTE